MTETFFIGREFLETSSFVEECKRLFPSVVLLDTHRYTGEDSLILPLMRRSTNVQPEVLEDIITALPASSKRTEEVHFSDILPPKRTKEKPSSQKWRIIAAIQPWSVARLQQRYARGISRGVYNIGNPYVCGLQNEPPSVRLGGAPDQNTCLAAGALLMDRLQGQTLGLGPVEIFTKSDA